MEIKLDDGKIRLKKHINGKDAVSVLVAGDFCPRNRPERFILDGRSREMLASIVPELYYKDLSIVNMEGALTRGGTPIGKHGPRIRVDPGCVDFLKTARFDVACLANNHVGDFGPDAVMETIHALSGGGLHTVGAGRNLPAAAEPLFINVKGKSIGIYACSINMGGLAGKDKAGVNPLRPRKDVEEIKQISRISDITLVIIHKGSEMYPLPGPGMVRICRSFVRAGASAVIAIHAHCPQGLEIYHGCPIVYNLGNFLFDRRKGNTPDRRYAPDTFWWKGYMVRITFDKARAAALEVIPYTFGPDAERIVLLTNEERQKFMRYLEHLSGFIDSKEEIERFWKTWNSMKRKDKASKNDEPDKIYKDKIKKLQKGIIE